MYSESGLLIAWQEDGFTYEREAISKWLKDHDTSPKTGEPLQSKALIPNHVCRAMIRDFQEAQAKRAQSHSPPSAGVQQPAWPVQLEPQGASTSTTAASASPGPCGRRVWGMVDG